jgi:hypothetical protein
VICQWEVKLSDKDKPLWNSLEISKLVTSGVGALVVAIMAWQLQSVSENSKRLAGKQAELYDKIGPKLNELYSYYFYVGRWKEQNPDGILATKRALDEVVYSNRLYFSQTFFDQYNVLMGLYFQTGTGWGKDAKLNTSRVVRDRAPNVTDVAFKDRFTEKDNRDQICIAYNTLLAYVAKDLGIGSKANVPSKCAPKYILPSSDDATNGKSAIEGKRASLSRTK